MPSSSCLPQSASSLAYRSSISFVQVLKLVSLLERLLLWLGSLMFQDRELVRLLSLRQPVPLERYRLRSEWHLSVLILLSLALLHHFHFIQWL